MEDELWKNKELPMNCQIRQWKLSDKFDLSEVLNNKKLHDNLRDGLPIPYLPADAEEFINIMLNAEPDSMYPFAITLDDKVIGSIAVTRQQNIHSRTGELGYYIGEPYWGHGYTTEAVKQICDFVFEHTDIIRIFAEVFAENIASCRVLEKAGFVCEGTLRANAVKNGQVLDMKMYGLVKL